uniref:Uncharacterized protein n=1 Tax=Tanacetum cinerariifolium TaxID=118510 RepID=A0A699JL00_TANCI|nr:hypothetical protein [Tanacetum cinerariifolium]
MMASFFQMNTASTSGLRQLPCNIIANPNGKLKAITTRSGLILDGPSVSMPPPFINPEEDERAEETLTDLELVRIKDMRVTGSLWSVKVSSARSSSSGLMNGGGIETEGPSRTRPLQVVMAFSLPFGLAMMFQGSCLKPEVEAVFIWKKLAIMFLRSLVWLDIEA